MRSWAVGNCAVVELDNVVRSQRFNSQFILQNILLGLGLGDPNPNHNSNPNPSQVQVKFGDDSISGYYVVNITVNSAWLPFSV